jgi:VanZ family protein
MTFLISSGWKRPALRWVYAVGWTALLLVMLLQSSSQPVIGPAAPPGKPTLAREILLTTGHIIGFGVLTALWWWALVMRMPGRIALIAAMIISLTQGIVTEMAQATIPDRAASVFDLAVNGVVTLVTAWVIHRVSSPPIAESL